MNMHSILFIEYPLLSAISVAHSATSRFVTFIKVVLERKTSINNKNMFFFAQLKIINAFFFSLNLNNLIWFSTGLHLALSDPRTLGDVDFTIAHPNLPKIVHLPKNDQN